MFYLGHNNRVPYLSRVYSSLLALRNQGRYQIFMRTGFYWSVKTISFYQRTNQNRQKNDKNIELELYEWKVNKFYRISEQ